MSEEEIRGVSPIHEYEDIAPFLLKTPLEIAYVLRLLAQNNINIALYFNAGKDMMLSRVLSVDVKAQQFIMDIGGHEPTNQVLLNADKVLYVSSLEGVKIQFSTPKPQRITLDGKAAFLVSFPKDLVKLQRREFFRLTTPISTPYTATLPVENQGRMNFDLHDVSLGGVGIWLKDGQDKLFELGSIIEDAMLDMGPMGSMKVNLEVRNLYQVSLKQDITRWMLGVKFVSLSRGTESALQRLIVQLEREKKALTG
jgi:c-di-GMP-binding flagellar brake protein YcgR